MPIAYGNEPDRTSISICASDINAHKDKLPVNTVCQATISFKEIVITSYGLDGKFSDIDFGT